MIIIIIIKKKFRANVLTKNISNIIAIVNVIRIMKINNYLPYRQLLFLLTIDT